MAVNEAFPLRVDAVTTAWAGERRLEDSIAAVQTQGWQLVYVRSGSIEERCNDKVVLLRAGGILLHQPEETFAMRSIGEIPPEVLRMDFFLLQFHNGPFSRGGIPRRTGGAARPELADESHTGTV